MNRWQCEASGCTAEAVGVGGAIGLLAIGWYVVIGTEGQGPTILCPRHARFPRPGAEAQAESWQMLIKSLKNGDVYKAGAT